MEAKDQTVISTDDGTKDGQENKTDITEGQHSHSVNIRWDGGFQRKTYYSFGNNFQRPNRQGHNPHYHQNGYNHPYNHNNNGYNNGNNYHHQHQHHNGYRNHNNRGNYRGYNGHRQGNSDNHSQFQSNGNGRFHNNHYNNHHYHNRQQRPDQRSQPQPILESDFTSQTELQPPQAFPQFVPPSSIEPIVPPVVAPHGTVFTTQHFVFPEIPFRQGDKLMNQESQAQRGLTQKWGSYDTPEGIDDSCGSLQLPESPGSTHSQGSAGSNGAYKNRFSNGQLTNRISPTPPQQFYRPFWDNQPYLYENQWNWNHILRFHDLMDKFDYVDESEKPDELAPIGHMYEQLSEQIWTKFQHNQQTVDTFTRKLELWRDLSACVRKYNQSYQLEVVGSTISGFGSNSSDVDMCLILDHRNSTDPRTEAIEIMEALCPLFEELVPNLTRKELILAKVPILKLRETVHGIDVDVNVNNAVGVRNTLLLHSYALCDWRVRPLVLVVKLWAQTQGINDAKLMTLSSYSLALMVIHYLQHGVSPQILPSLQITFPDRFQQLAELWRVKKSLSDTVPAVEALENTESLGDLLVGFMEYFAIKFDFKCNAISVRNGATMTVRACSISRAPKNDAYQWKHICIEEPFEFTNTARSVYDKDSFDRIRGTFFSSWQRLVISRNLETIFQPISPIEARSIGARARQCSTS